MYLDRFFDCDLDKLDELWLLLHQIQPWVDDNVWHDAVQVARVDVSVMELRLRGPKKA
jgi:hypothetical protein